MELLDEVKDLSEVPSEWQALYKQDEDVWKINKPEDTNGLKSALQKERDARKELEKQMKKVENPDEELEVLRQEVETLRTEKAEKGVRETLRASAVRSGIKEEHLEDVITLTRSKFVINEEGYLATEDGKSSDRFFSGTYKKNKPIFYKGSGKSGSGAAPNLGKGGVKEKPKSWKDSVAEKSKKLIINT